MWIARNEKTKKLGRPKKGECPYPRLTMFFEEPTDCMGSWIRSAKDNKPFFILNPYLYPDLKYEDGPREILTDSKGRDAIITIVGVPGLGTWDV